MKINQYIEEHSKVDVKDETITVTICVPKRKIVDFASQQSNETHHIVLRTEHIVHFLEDKGFSVEGIIQTSSVNNNHPKGLTGIWIFSATPAKKRISSKRKKTTQTKKKEV